MNCECNCGSEVMVIHKDLPEGYIYKLCRNCEVGFVNHSLTPKQFFSLIKNGHKVTEFMLHDDFYDDETGEALQPRI